MMDNFISQAELDSLLRKNGDLTDPDQVRMSPEDLEVMAEVGNVTMSAASEAMSKFLKKPVGITPPAAQYLSTEDAAAALNGPACAAVIKIKGDLIGDTVIAIDPAVAAMIATLAGGKSVSAGQTALSSSDLGYLTETFNHLAGYVYEALSEMTDLQVEPFTAEMALWENEVPAHLRKSFDAQPVCVLTSDLNIEGVGTGRIWHFYAGDHGEAIVTGLQRKYNPEPEAPAYAAATPAPIAPAPIASAPIAPAPVAEASRPAAPSVDIQKPIFAPLKESARAGQQKNLDLIMDVPLELSVVLGKTKKTIKDILALGTGSVVELNKLADEPLEIFVNGKLVAHGEVVVIGENFGIRITQILSREQRVEGLK